MIFTLSYFNESLLKSQPPEGISELLIALWYDAKNDWEKAHFLVQKQETADYCLVHAYLHRKEGDAFNAGYWYRKARQEMPLISLEEEWKELVLRFLKV